MNIDEFELALQNIVPSPVIDREKFGIGTWFHIYFKEKSFAVQVIPGEGIGVSELDLSLESDFSGHDEECQDFDSVFKFITEKLAH